MSLNWWKINPHLILDYKWVVCLTVKDSIKHHKWLINKSALKLGKIRWIFTLILFSQPTAEAELCSLSLSAHSGVWKSMEQQNVLLTCSSGEKGAHCWLLVGWNKLSIWFTGPLWKCPCVQLHFPMTARFPIPWFVPPCGSLAPLFFSVWRGSVLAHPLYWYLSIIDEGW